MLQNGQQLIVEYWGNGDGVRHKEEATVLDQRFTTWYAGSPNRMRAWFQCYLIRTQTGRLLINSPRYPAYPEEVDLTEVTCWVVAAQYLDSVPRLDAWLQEFEQPALADTAALVTA